MSSPTCSSRRRPRPRGESERLPESGRAFATPPAWRARTRHLGRHLRHQPRGRRRRDRRGRPSGWRTGGAHPRRRPRCRRRLARRRRRTGALLEADLAGGPSRAAWSFQPAGDVAQVALALGRRRQHRRHGALPDGRRRTGAMSLWIAGDEEATRARSRRGARSLGRNPRQRGCRDDHRRFGPRAARGTLRRPPTSRSPTGRRCWPRWRRGRPRSTATSTPRTPGPPWPPCCARRQVEESAPV